MPGFFNLQINFPETTLPGWSLQIMASKEFQFTLGNQSFYGLHWPETSPQAVLAIIHGHGEHIGRYHHVANHFRQQGLAVIGHDNYGHGRTPFKKGHTPSYEALLDSIAGLLAQTREFYPGIPIFLFGQSLGGNLVGNFMLRRPDTPQLAGGIMSSPFLELAFRPSPIDVFLAKLMMRIYPAYTQPSKLDATGLSHLAEEVEKYRNDPLVHDLISPVMFLGSLAGGQYALDHIQDLTLPLLLMHGDADPITSHTASAELARRAPALLTWRSWPGLYHELHNEAEAQAVLNYTSDWLLDQL
jgi:alpha-beta hydrolase superfamily lysophospholipase